MQPIQPKNEELSLNNCNNFNLINIYTLTVAQPKQYLLYLTFCDINISKNISLIHIKTVTLEKTKHTN